MHTVIGQRNEVRLLIPIIVTILIVGIIMAIKKRSLYPFLEMVMYVIASLLFYLFQFILSFLGDTGLYHLAIPYILTIVAVIITNKIIEKIDWHY